jgi:hypothetical protein
MFGPQPRHVQPSSLSRVNQAYSTSYPGSKDLIQTCPAPSPDMFDLSALSRVTPVLSDFLAELQRWWPDMSDPRPGHVRVFDSPTARFPCRTIKGPHASLAGLATQFNLQTLWGTLLSSQHLASKLHSNPSFLGEIWASLLSDSLDLQLKHFTDDDLRVFITLGDSFP